MRHTEAQAESASEEAAASLRASSAIVKASDQRATITFGAVSMNDAPPEAAGWLAVILTKLLPAGVGALLMVAVRPPVNRRELFARVFVALAMSVLFTDFAFDLLQSFSLFAFLSEGKKSHVAAVAGVLGSVGWFVVGGAGVYLDRFRTAPIAAVEEAKKVLP